MTVFPATKGASLSLPPCCLYCCVVLHVSECPRAENVTSHTRDVTPRDARRKQKYIFLLRKKTKIKVTHSDLIK